MLLGIRLTLQSKILFHFIADIKCFGGDCYAAVFGFNAIVLILGTGG